MSAARILTTVVEAGTRKIRRANLDGSAGEDGSVIVGKILEKDQYSYGFDSQTGEYVNLISKGLIDPTIVHPSELDEVEEADEPVQSTPPASVPQVPIERRSRPASASTARSSTPATSTVTARTTSSPSPEATRVMSSRNRGRMPVASKWPVILPSVSMPVRTKLAR